ncbi:MAG: glutamate racemase, partial [Chloroflexi bacterium]|nr:glutamate racemase [Chloroflexota bacterium]
QVIDPAQAVARQVQRVLMRHSLETDAACVAWHRFYTTGQPEPLATLVAHLSRQRAEVTRVETLIL